MKLAVQEAAYGFTDVYKLTAAQITALGTTNQVKIATLPSGGIVTQAAVFEVVNFDGTSSNLTLDVGTTTADPDEFIDALDLDGLTKAAFCTGDGFTVTDSGSDTVAGARNGIVNNTASALNIVAEPTFTGTVTAGEWLICLTILDPGPLAQ
jgi:hypothetical protein